MFEILQHDRHYARCLICILLFKLHKDVRQVLSFTFSRNMEIEVKKKYLTISPS